MKQTYLCNPKALYNAMVPETILKGPGLGQDNDYSIVIFFLARKRSRLSVLNLCNHWSDFLKYFQYPCWGLLRLLF